MGNEYPKPIPYISELSRPYWDAARRHELVLQKCSECGHYRYPPGESCPRCLSGNLEWERVNGQGKVFSWVVFHQVYHRTFADDVPYAVVIIELDQGVVRMISNLVDCRMEDIRVGLPVEVVYDDVTDEVSLLRFRPQAI